MRQFLVAHPIEFKSNMRPFFAYAAFENIIILTVTVLCSVMAVLVGWSVLSFNFLSEHSFVIDS